MDNKEKMQVLANPEDMERQMQEHGTLMFVENYLISEIDNLRSLFSNLKIHRPQLAASLAQSVISTVLPGVFPSLTIATEIKDISRLILRFKINKESAIYVFDF